MSFSNLIFYDRTILVISTTFNRHMHICFYTKSLDFLVNTRPQPFLLSMTRTTLIGSLLYRLSFQLHIFIIFKSCYSDHVTNQQFLLTFSLLKCLYRLQVEFCRPRLLSIVSTHMICTVLNTQTSIILRIWLLFQLVICTSFNLVQFGPLHIKSNYAFFQDLTYFQTQVVFKLSF